MSPLSIFQIFKMLYELIVYNLQFTLFSSMLVVPPPEQQQFNLIIFSPHYSNFDLSSVQKLLPPALPRGRGDVTDT